MFEKEILVLFILFNIYIISDSDTAAIDVPSTSESRISTSTTSSEFQEEDMILMNQSLFPGPSSSSNRKRKKEDEIVALMKKEVSCFEQFCADSRKFEEERLQLMRESNNIQRELLNAFRNN